MKGEVRYNTTVKLGERYRSKRFGIEGFAVEVHFTETSGQVVILERMDGPELRRTGFDPSEVEPVSEEINPAGFKI